MKKVLKFILLPISIFFILGTILNYNYNTHTVWSCGYSYVELPMPDYLNNSTIIFEKPIYGLEQKVFEGKCTSIFSETDTFNKIWMEKTLSHPNEITPGIEFTIYKRIYLTCGSIICMGGGGGDMLLLKDKSGKIWEADPYHFDPKVWGSSSGSGGQFLFKAGYYKNGIRLGDVVLERGFPSDYDNANWLR